MPRKRKARRGGKVASVSPESKLLEVCASITGVDERKLTDDELLKFDEELRRELEKLVRLRDAVASQVIEALCVIYDRWPRWALVRLQYGEPGYARIKRTLTRLAVAKTGGWRLEYCGCRTPCQPAIHVTSMLFRRLIRPPAQAAARRTSSAENIKKAHAARRKQRGRGGEFDDADDDYTQFDEQ